MLAVVATLLLEILPLFQHIQHLLSFDSGEYDLVQASSTILPPGLSTVVPFCGTKVGPAKSRLVKVSPAILEKKIIFRGARLVAASRPSTVKFCRSKQGWARLSKLSEKNFLRKRYGRQIHVLDGFASALPGSVFV
jgi:hypothetical protein